MKLDIPTYWPRREVAAFHDLMARARGETIIPRDSYERMLANMAATRLGQVVACKVYQTGSMFEGHISVVVNLPPSSAMRPTEYQRAWRAAWRGF